MDIKIEARPGASVARVRLDEGETLTAEVGAMIAMTPDIDVESSIQARLPQSALT